MQFALRHAPFIVAIVLASLSSSSANRGSEKLDASIAVEAADDSSQTEKLVVLDNSSRNDDCKRLCDGQESCKSYPNLCGKCDICANTAFLKFRRSMDAFTQATCVEQKTITDKVLGNPQPWCGFLFTPEQGCFYADTELSDGSMYWGCYYVRTVSQELKWHDHNGKLLYPTGILYDGDFKCGTMEGSGTWFYEDGQAMVTPMKAGKAAGDGLIWSAERDQVFVAKDGEVVKDAEGKQKEIPWQHANAILETDLKRDIPKKRV